jgi:Uri superfamily endonuclease
MEKIKSGYLDPVAGLVFCHYGKSYKNGEYWVTPDQYKERIDKRKKRHVERWANEESYRKSIFARSKSEKSKNQEEKRKKTEQYKAKRKQYIKFWAVEKCKTDNLFVLKRRLRARLGWAFNQTKAYKTQKTERYIGTTWGNCMEFIECQFQECMSWENKNQWHIDHFFPISMAKDEKQLTKLLHFTNLRPMWASDNIRKSCLLPPVNEIIERDKFVTNWITQKYSLT